MDRPEMLVRAGFYAGCASRLLGDDSYFKRFLGRAEELTEAQYLEMVADISTRLVTAGKLRPDEDLYETAANQAYR